MRKKGIYLGILFVFVSVILYACHANPIGFTFSPADEPQDIPAIEAWYGETPIAISRTAEQAPLRMVQNLLPSKLSPIQAELLQLFTMELRFLFAKMTFGLELVLRGILLLL
ncbi:MAG: hypothetical protein Q4F79_10385 [Eubacteriales bacterium]|nr:hypothetical protein [Eubacteriales bacterium]